MRVGEVVTLPMNTRFRRVTHREGMLIHGEAGVGEFSPFGDYDDHESASWLGAALEAADQPFPAAQRDRVPVNCTVPAVPPEQAAAIVTGGHGCQAAKVKVAEQGQHLDDDLARVSAVRDALGAGGRVRVDANGAWSVDDAVDAIGRLARYDLEYVEQPAATVEELAAVRRRVGVPVAADESIRRADDPLRVAALDAADVVVLKVQPLGGVRRSLRLAEEIGLPVVVSSAVESSVGLAAGVALAAALPALPYACGLGTASLLDQDVTPQPLRPVGGYLPVGRVDPVAAYVDRAAADEETVRRWHLRYARCLAVLRDRAS